MRDMMCIWWLRDVLEREISPTFVMAKPVDLQVPVWHSPRYFDMWRTLHTSSFAGLLGDIYLLVSGKTCAVNKVNTYKVQSG